MNMDKKPVKSLFDGALRAAGLAPASAAEPVSWECTLSEGAARVIVEAFEVADGEGQLGADAIPVLRAIATQHPDLAKRYYVFDRFLDKGSKPSED